MILMEMFRVFILVVLCGILIRPSQGQTFKCARGPNVKTCDDDAKTPNCGIDFQSGNPGGCMDDSECPDSITAELSCQDGKIGCCCKATATAACNDLHNNLALREKACKLKELEGSKICGKQITCHDDTDMPMPKKCRPSYLCGTDKIGEHMGCIDPAECSRSPTSEFMCTIAPYCCCNADNCNTRAKVCEAIPKAPGCSPAPPPTGGPITSAGGSTSEQATAVPVSVGSVVCMIVSVGLTLSNE